MSDETPEFDPNEPRKIESAVKVWLMWDHAEKRWVVDPVSVDGYPLDSPYDGLGLEFYDEGRELTAEDREAFELARNTDLPTAEVLSVLIDQASVERAEYWAERNAGWREDAAHTENERRKAALEPYDFSVGERVTVSANATLSDGSVDDYVKELRGTTAMVVWPVDHEGDVRVEAVDGPNRGARSFIRWSHLTPVGDES